MEALHVLPVLNWCKHKFQGRSGSYFEIFTTKMKTKHKNCKKAENYKKTASFWCQSHHKTPNSLGERTVSKWRPLIFEGYLPNTVSSLDEELKAWMR